MAIMFGIGEAMPCGFFCIRREAFCCIGGIGDVGSIKKESGLVQMWGATRNYGCGIGHVISINHGRGDWDVRVLVPFNDWGPVAKVFNETRYLQMGMAHFAG